MLTIERLDVLRSERLGRYHDLIRKAGRADASKIELGIDVLGCCQMKWGS